MFNRYSIEWWASAWLLCLALSLSVVMLVRDLKRSRADRLADMRSIAKQKEWADAWRDYFEEHNRREQLDK